MGVVISKNLRRDKIGDNIVVTYLILQLGYKKKEDITCQL